MTLSKQTHPPGFYLLKYNEYGEGIGHFHSDLGYCGGSLLYGSSWSPSTATTSYESDHWDIIECRLITRDQFLFLWNYFIKKPFKCPLG